MTSGCYPGCINCIGSLAQDQITILGKRVEGSTFTQGVVAVPKRTALGKRVVGLAVTPLEW